MDDSTKLFGEQTIGHWKVIRQKIMDNPNEANHWKEATNLLELRLKTRYFDPISSILNIPNNDKEESLCSFVDKILSGFGLSSSSVMEENSVMALRGEGFAAMTLICSLIEFLQSCYEGRKYKNETNVNNLNLNFEYSLSGVIFKRFLECHEPFTSQFTNTTLNKTFFDDFYSNVRCGLLHEAATNNDWIVRQKSNATNFNKFVDVTDESKKIIFRDNFFEEIKIYFDKYKQKIINDEKGDIMIAGQNRTIHLRHAFCRKIDFLCDILFYDIPAPSPKWWDLREIYIEN